MSNIAEEFERGSDREFMKFLYIAKGSCGELRSLLHIAYKLAYIDSSSYEKLTNMSEEISKTVSGLIKSLSKSKGDKI